MGVMSRKFQKRMEYSFQLLEEKLKAKFPSIATYGLILGGVIAVISLIVRATADDIAANIGAQIWKILKTISSLIIDFASGHLVATVLILLIVWIGFLVFRVYQETKPPSGIIFFTTEPRHVGIFRWLGFEVENRSGENLNLAWIKHKESGKRIHWGTEERNSNFTDIPNGDKKLMEWLCYNTETKQSHLRSPGSHIAIPVGTHEIEFEFSATPMGKSSSLPIRSFFANVEVTETGARILNAGW